MDNPPATDRLTGSETLEELRSKYERLANREAEIMKLLGTPSPDKLVHDLRNLLNEVILLRELAALKE
jgi:hypothetical protein